MPNKIKFTEDQLSELEEKVEQGHSYKTLQEHFDQSYKVLRRIIEENDLKEKMDKNIHRVKAEIAQKNQKSKAIERYKSIHQKYSDEIKELIEEGGLLKDVSDLIDKSNSFSKAYLEYVGLDEKRKENSERVLKKKATEQALKNVREGENHPSYREFTEKEKSYYIDKVNRGWHKWKIFRNMYSKFGLSENKFNELVDKFDKKPNSYSFEGENNPMYGKSPSNEAGFGIWGHYKKSGGNTIHFRSSLELRVFYDLDKKGVNYSLSNLRIDYEDSNQNSRTYVPDIVIDNSVYEIKPSSLVDHEQNVRKKNALVSFCEENPTHEYGGYITAVENELNLEKVNRLREEERILIDDKQYKRLKNNL